MSKEVITLISLLGVVYAIQFTGGWILDSLMGSMESFWGEAGWRTELVLGDTRNLFIRGILIFATCCGIPLLVAMLAAVLGTVAQTRGLVTFSKLKPKFSNLNPINGLKKIISLKGLVELLKSILTIVVLGYGVVNQFLERFGDMPRLFDMEFQQLLFYCAGFIMDIITSVAVIFAALAAADFMYQRWDYEKNLRMSKQEIKEEYKQTEGDPQIKGKIRQKQQQMAMNRMMQQVPSADVVIRNPTHFAVAIRYNPDDNSAPVVLAKGQDLVALRIIKRAEDAGVTIYEDKPLARGLYESVPLDAEIPAKFFQPVAEVLAFVYSTVKKDKGKDMGGAPAPNR